MKPNIMFVDDSVSVIESIKWIFMDEPYYLFVFDSPIDALNVIKLSDFAVAVVDQSMRKMDGLEFLKRVKVRSPHTLGIIMAGHIGIKETINTVYPDCVYRFVKKPLDKREIKHAVKSAITHHELNAEIKGQAVPYF